MLYCRDKRLKKDLGYILEVYLTHEKPAKIQTKIEGPIDVGQNRIT